jgi:hypothetical protein
MIENIFCQSVESVAFLLLINGQRNYFAFLKAATDFTDYTDMDELGDWEIREGNRILRRTE